MEKIIKENHIFNNVVLALRPRVIKVSLKSDMSIVWIDIWNVQSSIKTKNLINQCFNVGSYITTICGANMNQKSLNIRIVGNGGMLLVYVDFKGSDM